MPSKDKLNLYIAGPMRGIHLFNFPSFDRAKRQLHGLFDEIRTPADNDRILMNKIGSTMGKSYAPDWVPDEMTETGGGRWLRLLRPDTGRPFELRTLMQPNIDYINNEATHVLFLSGWENSSGSKLEHELAIALGLHLLYEHPTNFYGFHKKVHEALNVGNA